MIEINDKITVTKLCEKFGKHYSFKAAYGPVAWCRDLSAEAAEYDIFQALRSKSFSIPDERRDYLLIRLGWMKDHLLKDKSHEEVVKELDMEVLANSILRCIEPFLVDYKSPLKERKTFWDFPQLVKDVSLEYSQTKAPDPGEKEQSEPRSSNATSLSQILYLTNPDTNLSQTVSLFLGFLFTDRSFATAIQGNGS